MQSGKLCRTRLLAIALGITALGTVLDGCVPLVAVGMGAGAMSVVDRRTMGAQIEDQSIQSRGNARLKDVLPGDENAYATINSFNRRVLLVGRAPDEKTKELAAQQVGTLGNVKMIHNEIRVGGPVISAARDTALTARVKGNLLQVKELDLSAVKVITEDSVVYLMGLVTAKESKLASDAVSAVPGVTRVVTLFDVISEEELIDLIGKPPEPPSSPRR